MEIKGRRLKKNTENPMRESEEGQQLPSNMKIKRKYCNIRGNILVPMSLLTSRSTLLGGTDNAVGKGTCNRGCNNYKYNHPNIFLKYDLHVPKQRQFQCSNPAPNTEENTFETKRDNENKFF